MEIFACAFLGGLFGALLMDITETIAARFGITSGANVALIGRWYLSILNGQFRHANIVHTKPYPHEVKTGWIFHLLVGGGCVALLYPLFFSMTGSPLPGDHILGCVLFGLLTSALPWFVLLPSFGWGQFGRRGPAGTNAVLASLLSHVPYGFGVGIVMTLGGA